MVWSPGSPSALSTSSYLQGGCCPSGPHTHALSTKPRRGEGEGIAPQSESKIFPRNLLKSLLTSHMANTTRRSGPTNSGRATRQNCVRLSEGVKLGRWHHVGETEQGLCDKRHTQKTSRRVVPLAGNVQHQQTPGEGVPGFPGLLGPGEWGVTSS